MEKLYPILGFKVNRLFYSTPGVLYSLKTDKKLLLILFIQCIIKQCLDF